MKRGTLVAGLPEALIACLLAVIATVTFNNLESSLGTSIGLVIVSYVVVWVPLLVALVWAYFRGGKSFTTVFGWAFKPIDILWGVAVAIFLRSVSVFLDTLLVGYPLNPPILSLGSILNPQVVAVSVVIPVLVAPLIEELFFRGLLLRSLIAQLVKANWSQPLSNGVGIAVVSVFFGAVHVLNIPWGNYFALVFLTTALLGVATGLLVVSTGRLGGAIIAHIVNNGLIIFAGISWN